jgi:hypothetical protein
MRNTRKLAGHAFVLLVIEPDSTFARATFRWCKQCGLVLTTFRPRLGERPVHLLPEGLSANQMQPPCARRSSNWGLAS